MPRSSACGIFIDRINFNTVLIFVRTEILPGDVDTGVPGQSATPDAVEAGTARQ
jgi:hypothetical protein